MISYTSTKGLEEGKQINGWKWNKKENIYIYIYIYKREIQFYKKDWPGDACTIKKGCGLGYIGWTFLKREYVN